MNQVQIFGERIQTCKMHNWPDIPETLLANRNVLLTCLVIANHYQWLQIVAAFLLWILLQDTLDQVFLIMTCTVLLVQVQREGREIRTPEKAIFNYSYNASTHPNCNYTP